MPATDWSRWLVVLIALPLCCLAYGDFNNCDEPCDISGTTWEEDDDRGDSPVEWEYHRDELKTGDCSGEMAEAGGGEVWVTATACGDHGFTLHKAKGYSLYRGMRTFQCKPQEPLCPGIGGMVGDVMISWAVDAYEEESGLATMQVTLNVVDPSVSTPRLVKNCSDDPDDWETTLSEIDVPYDGGTVKVWCEARGEAVFNPAKEPFGVSVHARSLAGDPTIDWTPWE